MNNEIVLCEKCNGSSTVKRSELVDYHNCIRKEWFESCDICKGSGRLLKIISYEPYVVEETGKNE